MGGTFFSWDCMTKCIFVLASYLVDIELRIAINLEIIFPGILKALLYILIASNIAIKVWCHSHPKSFVDGPFYSFWNFLRSLSLSLFFILSILKLKYALGEYFFLHSVDFLNLLWDCMPGSLLNVLIFFIWLPIIYRKASFLMLYFSWPLN